MRKRYLFIITIALTGFIGLTAIAGGVAILAGAEDFPMEWLEGSIFEDYTIPALILSIVVGGSALVATILLIRKHKLAPGVTMLAGIIMIGQIAGELIILKQEPSGPTGIEFIYGALGLVVLGLGV